MVRGDQNAHAPDAGEDAGDLGDVVSDLEEDERHDDYHGDGPEVDQLRAEHRGVLVGEDDEVVALHVAEAEDDIWIYV